MTELVCSWSYLRMLVVAASLSQVQHLDAGEVKALLLSSCPQRRGDLSGEVVALLGVRDDATAQPSVWQFEMLAESVLYCNFHHFHLENSTSQRATPSASQRMSADWTRAF